MQSLPYPPPGMALLPGINPGQFERCWNDADDNCDGRVNEGCRHPGGGPVFKKNREEIA